MRLPLRRHATMLRTSSGRWRYGCWRLWRKCSPWGHLFFVPLKRVPLHWLCRRFCLGYLHDDECSDECSDVCADDTNVCADVCADDVCSDGFADVCADVCADDVLAHALAHALAHDHR